jgi:phosphoenolpyruvate-protein kinase (PTS system EI component)
MAADPGTVGILLGLGLRELSVQPRAIPAVRRAIRAISIGEAEQLADSVLEGRNPGGDATARPLSADTN